MEQPAPLQYFQPANNFTITAPQPVPAESQAGTIPDTPTPAGSEFANPYADRVRRAQISKLSKDVQNKLAEKFFDVRIIGVFLAPLSDIEIDRQKSIYLTKPITRFTAGVTELSGTLNDPVMGPSEVCDICATCHRGIIDCLGHPGAILFREGLKKSGAPVLFYNPFFYEYLIMLIQAVCRNCAAIVIGEQAASAVRYTGTTKLSELAKLSEGKSCMRCGYRNPLIAKKASNQGNDPQIMEIPPGGKTENAVVLPIEKVWSIINRLDPEADYLTNELQNVPQMLNEQLGNLPQYFTTQAAKDEEIKNRKRILTLLGYTYEVDKSRGANPRAYIMSSILVPAPKYRMARYVGTEFQPNEFTVRYSEIMSDLIAMEGANSVTKEKLRARFIMRVRKIFYNTQGARPGQKPVSISTLLNKKGGKFRRDGQGKSLGEAARSVIDPDPTLPLGVVSIPEDIAAKLSIPITVTALNKEICQSWIAKDQVIQLSKLDSRGLYSVKYQDEIQKNKDQIFLQVGDIVSRQVKEGDRGIYYRAPTIHKFSLLMYLVRRHKGKNFRQGVAGLTGHNADFDGDEMSLAMIRSIEAQIEAEILMSQTGQLISSRASEPVAGPFYDAITAAARLTDPSVSFSFEIFCDALQLMTHPPDIHDLMSRAHSAYRYLEEDWKIARKKKQQIMEAMGLSLQEKEYKQLAYPGWLLFSAVLPPDFEYTGKEVVVKTKEKWVDTVDEIPRYQKKKVEVKKKIIIRHGVLVSSIIVQSAFGIAGESFVQQLVHNYSTERAVEFINDITQITDFVFSQLGMAIGPGDLNYIDPEYRSQIIEERVSLQKRTMAKEPPVKSFTTDDRLLRENEQYEKEALSDAEATVARMDNILDRTFGMTNGFVYFSRIGAKGNIRNSTQMFGDVGQSTLDGRIQRNLSRNQRTSVFYDFCDYAADTQGFCYSSLQEGLNAPAYAMHQEAGRRSLTQTANSTQRIGTFRRMLRASMESMIVAQDLSLRVSNGVIVQHIAGAAGWDPSQLRKVNVRHGTVTTFVNAVELAKKHNSELGFSD